MSKTSIIWIIVAVIVIIGTALFFAGPKSADTNVPADQQAAGQATDQNSAQTGSAPFVQVPNPAPQTTQPAAAAPGNNLTLGEMTNAGAGTYLVAYNGMTVYTYAPDTTNVSNCTGQCAVNWPPYIVTSSSNLVGESPISGKIGITHRADNSMQVTYNGHPLYFFKGDTKSGDIKGNGVSNIWFVVKP